MSEFGSSFADQNGISGDVSSFDPVQSNEGGSARNSTNVYLDSSVDIDGSANATTTRDYESRDSEDDPDPLELRKLALSYDYLIYKINDHVSTMADTTYQSILSKQKLIENNYFEDQLHLQDELDHVETLLDNCTQLELEFMKLDQLKMFIDDFKSRLDVLELEYSNLE
ncbi:hypothetical protein G9P44_004934 [Scheffersomyces stipitis]|nr:hypothetical protein G9P44_004934 [Scheffersomyces stipitis]